MGESRYRARLSGERIGSLSTPGAMKFVANLTSSSMSDIIAATTVKRI